MAWRLRILLVASIEVWLRAFFRAVMLDRTANQIIDSDISEESECFLMIVFSEKMQWL